MKLKSDYLSFFSFTVFFLIIPLLSYQVTLGYINDVFVRIISRSFILIVVIYFIFFVKKNYLDFFVFLTFILMYVIIQFNYIYDKDIYLYKFNISCFIYYIVMYCMGRFFVYNPIFNKWLIFVYLLYVLILYINLYNSVFQIMMKGDYGVKLKLGDTFAIVSILILTTIGKKYFKIFIFFISSIFLFAIGSRTSLYLYIFISIFYFIRNVSYKYIFISMMFLIGSVFYLINTNKIDIEHDRRIAILYNLSSDGSYNSRENLLKNGLNSILNNPVLGDYGGQFKKYNDIGSYIHNILSYYRQFGLVVFTIMIFYFFIINIYFFKWLFKFYDKKIDYIFYISLFLFIEILFSRAYSFSYVWFSIGMLFNKRNLIIYRKYNIKRYKSENCIYIKT
jgi:hypothetical protein